MCNCIRRCIGVWVSIIHPVRGGHNFTGANNSKTTLYVGALQCSLIFTALHDSIKHFKDLVFQCFLVTCMYYTTRESFVYKRTKLLRLILTSCNRLLRFPYEFNIAMTRNH